MKKLPKINTAKLLKAALPYIFIGLMATKLGQAYRMVPEGDVLDKALGALLNIGTAFQNPLPSFHLFDLMVGAVCGVLIWFIVYQKAKNARKYRRGAEYGTARWGTAKDIEPFIDPDFSQNMAQAVYELISDEGWEQAKLEAMDYDFLMEQAEAAERDKHIRMQAMAYVQDVLSDADLEDEVIITGAKVYISPYADPAKPDYDVLLEYEGDIREDEFFNLLHEQTFMIDGKPVDFNPITPAKSGTIQEYLAMLEQQAAQEPAPAQAEVLRVVPIGRFERYIEPSEVTQDQYIVKGGILLSPCASNPDFYESTNRALNGTYIDAQIYEVAERSKKNKPTAFRKAVDAPVENPLEPVGKEIGIIKAGGMPCGLVYKHEMEGFELQDHTILLQKERDAHGNYYSGLSLDGMMVKTPQMYHRL